MKVSRKERIKILKEEIKSRILILDGAMGTMIQKFKFGEDDYRGSRFKDWSSDLKGNNDILSITQPETIAEIHSQYLKAGADIVETNTFNANKISQADYNMEAYVYELNFESACLARKACDEISKATPEKPRFAAGALGPTNQTASISPNVNDPGERNINFDQLKEAYQESVKGLIDGGVDLLLVETVFDTLNAKAALFAIEETFDSTGEKMPVIVSGTITDLSGRTLSGQTAEAFWHSVRHANAFGFGFNCALGADQLYSYVKEISGYANSNICVYPNAGLPNEFGEYDQSPDEMACLIKDWVDESLINIVGGCCGTTPEHIAAIAQIVRNKEPRKIIETPHHLRLSGLEALTIES